MTLYDVLGLDKGASAEDVKKSFYKLSKLHHPDKGGDQEKFKEINHAYEILSDNDRRKMYDMTGSESEQGHGMGGGGMPADFFMGGMPFGGLGGIFGNMFGGGQPQRKRKMPKGPDKTQDIPLTLADFYKGKEIQMKFHQQRACGTCNATGAQRSETCGVCNGQGMRVLMRQIGPGMIQQSVQPCSDCGGEGKRILLKCGDCGGKKYKVTEKVLNAHIEPGIHEGERMRFVGECSDSPEYEQPGDVILVLLRTGETGKTDFEWNGNDLHMSIMVTMGEALLGFSTNVNGHPSGKDITLSWDGGKLQNGMMMVSKGNGMPVRSKVGEFGDLFVHIEVASSDSDRTYKWSVAEREALQSIFTGWTVPTINGAKLEISKE